MDNDRSTPPAPRYHPAAQGFTGDALDQLCKSRFTEGVEVGRAEAAEAAMQVIEERTEAARNEGHRAGVEVGDKMGRDLERGEFSAQIVEAGMNYFPKIAEALARIEKRTSSPEIKDEANAALHNLQRCGKQLGLAEQDVSP
jgi:hypothetical protein